jgi:hypothetical protein
MFRFMIAAVLGFLLTASACAEPKASPVSLEDLKYAVTKAQERGENVSTIAEAVKTLEKALAKFAGKPGEAPPELTALRDTVEAVARKGENVEAISKELGRIEKALTGQAYERPKPPEPKLDPDPPLRGGRGVGINGNRVVIGGGFNGRITINGAGGNFNATSITIVNGTFTIKARQGEVTYTVSGEMNADAVKIVVETGEKKIEAEDIKKLPQEHRPAVEELLRMITK